MPLLQIFNSFCSYFDSSCRNPVGPSQPRYTSKEASSGSKRHLPEEIVLDEIRKDPLWKISEGESNAFSQQPAKRQRNGSHNSLTNKDAALEKKSLLPKVSSEIGQRTSCSAHNPTGFMENHGGICGASPQLPASFHDVVYVRKSLLSPEQLQVAAATEQAIRAHETLRSLRSKAMSQTVADSHTTYAHV
jgi:hypothetical protein